MHPSNQDVFSSHSQEHLALLRRLLSGKYLIVGVGSPLRSDDQAGLLFCDELLERGIECVKCEYGLENCIGEIAGRRAERLVIVDAVIYDGAKPGEVVIAGEDALVEKYTLATTHSIPVKMLIRMLREAGVRDIYVVGIAPSSLDYGLDVSSEVVNSIRMLVELFVKALEGSSKSP